MIEPGFIPLVLLYIGPETILPITSALAAAAGVLLMFWHKVSAWIAKIWRVFVRKNTRISDTGGPSN